MNLMPNKYLLALLILCLAILLSSPAIAATPATGADAMYNLHNQIQAFTLGAWGTRISQYALGLLFTTSLIAFAIGCKDLALSGGLQLEGIVALLVRFAFLTGMMAWLLTNPVLLYNIPRSLGRLGGLIISGAPRDVLALDSIAETFGTILIPIIDYNRTLSWYEIGLSLTCVVLVFFINCLSILFITTILLVKIETFFVFIGGMLTAAFFVLGYFRDIFMGYIKALVMNGLKLLLLSLCLGLMQEIINGWGGTLGAAADANSIYDTFIPMTFGLMAFYIVIKSVPQYAVAILTGHASADGGLARAALMAGIGTTATVWNVSRGVSNTAINTASTVNNATQAYKNTATSVIESGGSKSQAAGLGAWEALKTVMSSQVSGRSRSGGSGVSTGAGLIGGSERASNNEMKPGGAFDAYRANDSYNQNMEG